MYAEKRSFRVEFPIGLSGMLLCLMITAAGGQNLLAVLDLVGDGNVPQEGITAVCNKISAVIAEDTSYFLFERAQIPELLKQLSIDESATTCSDVQCLTVIGSLIGANTIVGGSISYVNQVTSVTLNMVGIAAKKAINTVTMSSRSKKDILINTEIPALVKSLMAHGTGSQAAAPEITKKKSVFSNPILYIGTLLVGGAAGGGAYYYKYYYKKDTGGDGPAADPELSLDDAPSRTR